MTNAATLIRTMTPSQLNAALGITGYTDTGIIAATFVKMTAKGDKAIYVTAYEEDGEDGLASGFVYVEYNKAGLLVADY